MDERNANCKCGFKDHPRVAEICEHFIALELGEDWAGPRDCVTCGHWKECHTDSAEASQK